LAEFRKLNFAREMPELPEVETVVRDLRPLVVGRTIRAVRHGKKKLRVPWKPAWNSQLAGLRIEAIRRRGKWIVVDLVSRDTESAKWSAPRLLVHLGMSGRFTAVEAERQAPNHLHVVFELDGRRELRFRDPRRFGCVILHADEAAIEAHFAAIGLGPEPFEIDADYFRAAVRKSARSLKAILLDQSVLAGVGNIYADEACSLSGLHPGRHGSSLSHAEVDRLREAIEAVLKKAIVGRGSTIRDYVGGSGQSGGYQNEFRVYGRTGEPCLACAAPIECVRLAGRSSHYCPKCQLMKSPRSAPRTPRRG
jgi:formamidopyrimidine-DNA glycosylase